MQYDKVNIIGDEGQGDTQNNNDILGVYIPRTLNLYIYQAGATSTTYFYFFFMFKKKNDFL